MSPRIHRLKAASVAALTLTLAGTVLGSLTAPADASSATTTAHRGGTNSVFGASPIQATDSPWVHARLARTDPLDDATGPGVGALALNPAELAKLSAYPTIGDETGRGYVVVELRTRSQDLLHAVSRKQVQYDFTWQKAGKKRTTTFVDTFPGENGNAVASAVKRDGKATTCAPYWTSGYRPGASGNTITGMFPTSCIGASTFGVSATIRTGDRQVDSVTARGAMTAKSSDFRSTSGTFSRRFVNADGATTWAGSDISTITYRPSDRMVHITQQFRGRAPSFDQTSLTWTFDGWKASPLTFGTGLTFVPGRTHIALTHTDAGWTVNGQKSRRLSSEMSVWADWDCATFGTEVQFDDAARQLTIDIPAECFDGAHLLRASSDNVVQPRTSKTGFAAGSPAVRLY